ncbi:MAG: hypothetical protein U0793_01280 [Gemmataceae bacterium]
MSRMLIAASVVVLLSHKPAVAQDRFRPLSDDEACSVLGIDKQPLPTWARVLAKSLPGTTVAMLGLDELHRARNPLGPVLSGKLRWVAADAVHCPYGRSYAESDLRRAGLSDADLKLLRDGGKRLPEPDRLALALARKLTVAAHSVSDEDMAALIKCHGPEKTVAIVHTVAHANFQNRLFLALGVALEKDEPLPPKAPEAPKEKPVAPERPPWISVAKIEVKTPALSLGWSDRTLDDVRKALVGQKERKGRIPLPDAERLEKLPPESRARVQKIVWSHVSMGYQPALTSTWFATMDRFHGESKLDRPFANTFFWVITRDNQCFY